VLFGGEWGRCVCCTSAAEEAAEELGRSKIKGLAARLKSHALSKQLASRVFQQPVKPWPDTKPVKGDFFRRLWSGAPPDALKAAS